MKDQDPDDQFKRPKKAKGEVNLFGKPKTDGKSFWDIIRKQKYRPLEELDQIADDYRLTPQ